MRHPLCACQRFSPHPRPVKSESADTGCPSYQPGGPVLNVCYQATRLSLPNSALGRVLHMVVNIPMASVSLKLTFLHLQHIQMC